MSDHRSRSLSAGRAVVAVLFIAQYASAQLFFNTTTAIGFLTLRSPFTFTTSSSSTINILSGGTGIIPSTISIIPSGTGIISANPSSSSSSTISILSGGTGIIPSTISILLHGTGVISLTPSSSSTLVSTTLTSSISSSTATGDSSFSSITSSSTGQSPTGVAIGITTSVIVEPGTTITEGVLTSESLTAPITLPPVTTTFVSSEATSAVSSVSSQILGILPIIISWEKDPIPLQTDTLNKIDDVKGIVENLISNLGTTPSSKPCNQKKKRGLFGFIGDVVNALSCITSELENVTNNIKGGIIEGVDDILSNIQSETEELTEEEENETKTDSESDTSSCTATQTAFQVTVLCGPTTYTTLGKTVSTTTCSSTATVTTTGCSATGSTTTISSSASSATQVPCASGTCGGACPLAGGPLSGASMGIIATTVNCKMVSTITTSALPTASYGVVGNSASKRELPNSPIDYNGTLIDDSKSLFERALLDVAAPYTNYVSGLSEKTFWVSQQGLTSGFWFDYPKLGTAAIGVNGIYGCTAVIISSEKGVYFSHIWENPVFINSDWAATDDASFISNTFNALRDGSGYATSITGLIGTDAEPGVLHAIYAPKVFVLTPNTSDDDRNLFQITTPLRYQARAEDLASRLARLIPGSGGSGATLGYKRTDAAKSTQPIGVAGRAILEVDLFQSWITTAAADRDPNGKGLQIGRWRLWVEDQLVSVQDFWTPNTTPPNAIVAREIGHPNPCKGNVGSKPTSSSQTTTTSLSSSTSSSQTSLISTLSTSTVTTSSNSLTKTDSTLMTTTSSSDSSTSTSSSAPPITSCTLSSQAALSTGNINIPATIACDCNDGWTAGIGSMVSDDEYTTYTCEVGTSTTIAVSTQAPPITSCTLSSQAALSTNNMNFPATIACDCNAGWVAGVGTTIGPDEATTWTCELGTSTTIAVSTQAPPTPTPAPAPPPFTPGTCNIHIFEASNGGSSPVYVGLQITDGGGATLASKSFQAKWSETATISKDDSKLPYDLNVEFSKSSKAPKRGLSGLSRRIGGAVPAALQHQYQRWVVSVTAGDTKWDSTQKDQANLPYCNVGGWDNGNFGDFLDALLSFGADQRAPTRQMDCKWAC